MSMSNAGPNGRVPCVIPRRLFLGAATAAFVAAESRPETGPAAAAPDRPTVCVFSKHLQFLEYKELGTVCAALGVEGVDLTVREGGHVLPENVARDLPRAVDAIRAAGVEVSMITTRMNDANDRHAATVLATAARVGIQYFRVGNHRYSGKSDPWEELPGFVRELRGLVALAEEHGMVAGYHNHSGYGNVGAPLWDLHYMIREIGSPHFGSNFDTGHATVEGGFGAWEINTRLMAPYIKMMAVKDFVWDGAEPRWVPLGTGNVKLARILDMVRAVGFAGPISMHFEYDVRSNDAMLDEVRAAAATLRASITGAGYA